MAVATVTENAAYSASEGTKEKSGIQTLYFDAFALYDIPKS